MYWQVYSWCTVQVFLCERKPECTQETDPCVFFDIEELFSSSNHRATKTEFKTWEALVNCGKLPPTYVTKVSTTVRKHLIYSIYIRLSTSTVSDINSRRRNKSGSPPRQIFTGNFQWPLYSLMRHYLSSAAEVLFDTCSALCCSSHVCRRLRKQVCISARMHHS